MQNFKIISEKNLLFNLKQFQKKRVCAMVKSNAYGHGIKEIVSMLSDKVDYFGVVSENEGKQVRRWTNKPILVCGRVQNFRVCKMNNLEFMIENETDLQRAIVCDVGDKCHLKIDSGMNRFGAKSELQMILIEKMLKENKIKLKSIATHFHCLEDGQETLKNYDTFLRLKKYISQQPAICFGGSNVIDCPFDYDMIRVGIGLYGYERKDVKPIMKIESYIAKSFYAKSGESIGYGNNYVVKKSGLYAVVPIGYGDGLFRNLSGKFCIEINGRKFHSVGKICMDVFFVKIDNSVKVGDKVVVMQNAEQMAKSVNTISYEILTNFSKCRAKTKIQQ